MRSLLLTLVLSVVLAGNAHAIMFISGNMSAGGGTWETVWDSPQNPADYDNGSNWNERDIITAAMSSAGGPWTKIRVTVKVESGTRNNLEIGVCIASTSPNCTAAPTTITYSSDETPDLSAGENLSDEITFSFDTDDEIILIYFSQDGIAPYFYNSGTSQWYDNTPSDARDQNVTGYTEDANIVGAFTLVEGWNPD